MIHILIGTRAQLIKMLPIMNDLDNRGIDYNFIFMAQHKATIYKILDQFKIKRPDYVICDTNKDIVKTKEMIIWSLKVILHGLFFKKKIFNSDRKGLVLIHGDAPPLFLGSLISKLQGLQVGVIEAGLRSFNYFKPFPEEIIRVFTARLNMVDVFFCQDKKAQKNVQKYNKKTYNTNGNTIYDTLCLSKKLKNIQHMGTQNEIYAIITIHRYETIRNHSTLLKVIDILKEINKKIKLKFILHPPTERALIDNNLIKELEKLENIELLPRLDFLSFNYLMQKTQFLITDGGSNQEEAAYLGIPCLLLRNETERYEGIGKNVKISKFNKEIINDFLKHYKKRKKTLVVGKKPTQIINDIIVNNYLNN